MTDGSVGSLTDAQSGLDDASAESDASQGGPQSDSGAARDGSVSGEQPDASGAEEDAAVAMSTQVPVRFAAGGSTPAYGGPRGEAFAEQCPEGHAIAGYRGFESTEPDRAHILRIQAVCGLVTLRTGSDPQTTVSDFTYLAEHGTDGSIRWERMCPLNQVVVAFSGYADSINFVNQLVFYCAPLVVTALVGGYALQVGSGPALSAVGKAMAEPFTRVDCPEGQVVTGNQGRSGFWLDALSLACGSPTIGP